MQAADDEIVWTHARTHGLIIVSKDSDFHQRSFVFGHPPKVIWIRRGNCSTAAVEQILRAHREDVARFAENPEGAFLALS